MSIPPSFTFCNLYSSDHLRLMYCFHIFMLALYVPTGMSIVPFIQYHNLDTSLSVMSQACTLGRTMVTSQLQEEEFCAGRARKRIKSKEEEKNNINVCVSIHT